MRLFGDGSSRVCTIEGGVAVSSRVGLGVELAVPSAVIASTSGNGFRASGRQEERVLLGLLYLLHRGEHLTQLPVLVPWQYEWESSTRVAIGVTGRLVW